MKVLVDKCSPPQQMLIISWTSFCIKLISNTFDNDCSWISELATAFSYDQKVLPKAYQVASERAEMTWLAHPIVFALAFESWALYC